MRIALEVRIDPVNLLYQFGVERIHVIAGNQVVVPGNHDPLYEPAAIEITRQ